MRHANISIFIPNNGCKNQCSFCNQKNITGIIHQPTISEVKEIVDNAAYSINKDKFNDSEIAFFGGSFTAIDREYMVELLKLASMYVSNGTFNGIRISTRPDEITPEVLEILKKYRVSAIELGAQSMNDDVLLNNKRGHTRKDIILASKLVKQYGFSLGLQMMTGLYSSNSDMDYKTGKDIITLNPDTVRIYPTVIMKGTYLAELYDNLEYIPMPFDETVDLCCKLILLFRENNIPIIRLGLHDSESLRDNMIAGPWHPSFNEICQSRLVLNRILSIIREGKISKGDIVLNVNPKLVSKVVGQKRKNLRTLLELGYNVILNQDSSLLEDDIMIKGCG